MNTFNPPIYIYAVGNYLAPAHEDHLLPLKQLVLDKTGVNLRRVSRFIQLSLIGAAECVQGLRNQQGALPSNAAVYLSSENGDMETVVEVLEAMYCEGQPPKPLSFINTVSNAACFYIGKTFNLLGESSFISAIGLAFEQALSTAIVDLYLQRIPAALIGSVDVCALPLSNHRTRIDASNDVVLGEGSHWLILASAFGNAKPLAELLEVRHVATLFDLQDSFVGLLMLGQHLSAADKVTAEPLSHCRQG